jgi:NAD(P)H-hydrate epimerase
LLGDDAALVQADRRAAARALATRYQGTVVLKGPGSLIAGPGGALAASLEGQPGMATAGMGDVLAGLIAGVWGPLGVGSDSADLNSAQRAAEVAVTLHGGAAGMAGAAGRVRSLTATGLLGWLPAAIELAEAQGDPRA